MPGNHRFVKVLLTLLLVLGLMSLSLDRQFYADVTDAFFSFTLASFLIIHLRIRPRWVDVASIVATTALLATVAIHLLHYPPTLMVGFSFLGLSSFVVMAIRSVWERERRLLLYAWVPAAIIVMTNHFARPLHEWTAKLHPKTFDLYLLSFDGSLRIQLVFGLGQYYARLPWLHNAALLSYVGLAIPMAVVYAGRLIRYRAGAFSTILAFLITGPLGYLFYNLFPACGPHYVFKEAFPFHPVPIAILSRLACAPEAFPGWRNAMPSLHLAWTLLAWWYSRGLSWIERLLAFFFLALTVVATLGTGEHWFVDLIVAFPYALMIHAICAYRVHWKAPVRRAAFFLGLGGTLGWMATLRYATAIFWTSPVVPWALCAATLAVVSLRQAKLEAAAKPDVLPAAAPALSTV